MDDLPRPAGGQGLHEARPSAGSPNERSPLNRIPHLQELRERSVLFNQAEAAARLRTGRQLVPPPPVYSSAPFALVSSKAPTGLKAPPNRHRPGGFYSYRPE